MDWDNLATWLFVCVAVISVAFYAFLIRVRDYSSTQFIRKLRLHHFFVGGMMGFCCPPELVSVLQQVVLLAALYLVIWFAAVIGCSSDVRLLFHCDWRDISNQFLLVTFLGIVVFCIHKLFFDMHPNNILSIGLLVGIVGLSWPLQRIYVSSTRMAMQPYNFISGAHLAGFTVICIVGLYQRNLMPIELYQPFSVSIFLHSPFEFFITSFVLGCILGVLLDLVTRGIDKQSFPYVVHASLMLGAGVGAGTGLDPLWIGLVAGAWLINTTLHRKVVLSLFRGRDGALNRALYFVAGGVVGIQLMFGAIDYYFGCWTFVVCVIQLFICLFIEIRKEEANSTNLELKEFDCGELGLIVIFAIILNGAYEQSAGAFIGWLLSRTFWTLVYERIRAGLLSLKPQMVKR